MWEKRYLAILSPIQRQSFKSFNHRFFFFYSSSWIIYTNNRNGTWKTMAKQTNGIPFCDGERKAVGSMSAGQVFPTGVPPNQYVIYCLHFAYFRTAVVQCVSLGVETGSRIEFEGKIRATFPRLYYSMNIHTDPRLCIKKIER